jgi:hypothetical protein
MTAAGRRRPGRRRDCPAWCEVDHGAPLDPVHRGAAAYIARGKNTVLVTLVSDPRRPVPLVTVDFWDAATDVMGGLALSPADARQLAGVLGVLGVDDLAGYLRTAADLVTETGSGGAS